MTMTRVQLDTENLLSAMPEKTMSMPTDDATATVVNKLFAQIKACKPAWQNAWGTAKAEGEAKRSWVKAFANAGITRIEQIQFGLEACRADPSDFVPGPGKFIDWCTPDAERLGLPSEDLAYREAVRNAHPSMMGHESWSHAAVYHAAIRCSLHSLRTASAETSRIKFAKAYASVRKAIARGEVLPPVPLALPAEPAGTRTPEKGRAAIAGLKAALCGGAQ
jgi:hypothetical protein